jgi:tetratricopeptide (TPR) repeat protein
MDPRQYAIFGNMAEAYKELKKYEEAIQSYTKALTSLAERPDTQVEASYHMNMALVYALAGNMENATAETKKAAELSPATNRKPISISVNPVNAGKTEEVIRRFKSH